MERIHCALHPCGKESDPPPPRDIVCCVVDHQLKEEILRKACIKAPLTHNGTEICLFQDLSSITLQSRRELRPILSVLHTKGIPYRWKFPFCLSASSQGRTALLRVPEDLSHTLEIPLTEVPKWHAEFQPHSARRTPPRSEPMETQEIRYRRQRPSSGSKIPITCRSSESQ